MKNKYVFEDKDIYHENFSIAWKQLSVFLNNNKITNDIIISIFNLDNKLVVSEYLEKESNFSENILELIEKLINENLYHENKLYVSDLISFANKWGLYIPYDYCLKMIIENIDQYLVLASIEYVYDYFRFDYISDIFSVLNGVLVSKKYHQTAQIKAAFILFRFSHNKRYLIDLIDLIKNGHKNNLVVIKNMLSVEYNSIKYFILPNELKKIID